MLATLLAGGLGLGAHRLATLSGETGEPVLIAVFVFIIGRDNTFETYLFHLIDNVAWGHACTNLQFLFIFHVPKIFVFSFFSYRMM